MWVHGGASEVTIAGSPSEVKLGEYRDRVTVGSMKSTEAVVAMVRNAYVVRLEPRQRVVVRDTEVTVHLESLQHVDRFHRCVG